MYITIALGWLIALAIALWTIVTAIMVADMKFAKQAVTRSSIIKISLFGLLGPVLSAWDNWLQDPQRSSGIGDVLIFGSLLSFTLLIISLRHQVTKPWRKSLLLSSLALYTNLMVIFMAVAKSRNLQNTWQPLWQGILDVAPNVAHVLFVPVLLAGSILLMEMMADRQIQRLKREYSAMSYPPKDARR